MDELAGLDVLAGPSTTAIVPDNAYRHRLRNVLDADDNLELSDDDEVRQEDVTADGVVDDEDEGEVSRFDQVFGDYEAGPSVSPCMPRVISWPAYHRL